MSDEYPAAGKGWTEEERVVLRGLWLKVAIADIAKALKRPPNGIKRQAKVLNLPLESSRSIIDKEFLAELRERGDF